jgi:hypothetical protein
MRPLTRTILRWAAVEILVVNVLGGWFSRHAGLPAGLLYPASWLVYALAGWEAARGRWRDGVVAGAAVAFLEQIAWLLQGAPNHGDTSGLPPVAVALTYITTVLFVSLIGAAFGAVGGLIVRRHRRVPAEAKPAASGASGA